MHWLEANTDELVLYLQELYHEMHALDRFEQDFQRKFHEEESVPAARRGTARLMTFFLKNFSR